MANEMSITQDFRQLSLTLPVDMVTVNLDVKMLKGQYTYSLTNNYTDLSFNPWSEDLQPSETFLKIVREMQIEPNSYYLETIMNQSLINNFATNCHRPKVTVIEQNAPQDDEINKQRQSPCSFNWSDTSMWQMTLIMKVQTKQNHQLTLISLPHQQVHEYLKIHVLMQTQ